METKTSGRVDTIMPTLYSAQGTKIKCHQGHCEHKGHEPVFDEKHNFLRDEFHEEGVCWKITQEEFADEQTEAKYCPCKKQSGLIRTYARLGYMERGEYDQMITRPCSKCGVDLLFTIHENVCRNCKVVAVTAQ